MHQEEVVFEHSKFLLRKAKAEQLRATPEQGTVETLQDEADEGAEEADRGAVQNGVQTPTQSELDDMLPAQKAEDHNSNCRNGAFGVMDSYEHQSHDETPR